MAREGEEGRAAAGGETDGSESIEAYETEVGMVLYDARNPLAWIESSVTWAIDDAA